MIYIIHFDSPYHHARHYVGFCAEGNLEQRLAQHRAGSRRTPDARHRARRHRLDRGAHSSGRLHVRASAEAIPQHASILSALPETLWVTSPGEAGGIA